MQSAPSLNTRLARLQPPGSEGARLTTQGYQFEECLQSRVLTGRKCTGKTGDLPHAPSPNRHRACTNHVEPARFALEGDITGAPSRPP